MRFRRRVSARGTRMRRMRPPLRRVLRPPRGTWIGGNPGGGASGPVEGAGAGEGPCDSDEDPCDGILPPLRRLDLRVFAILTLKRANLVATTPFLSTTRPATTAIFRRITIAAIIPRIRTRRCRCRCGSRCRRGRRCGCGCRCRCSYNDTGDAEVVRSGTAGARSAQSTDRTR